MPEEIIYDLFKEQPAECRLPLPYKELGKRVPMYIQRALFFDPSLVYERIRFLVNPFTRYNLLPFLALFPEPTDSLCQCGCGKKQARRGFKWASTDCQRMTRVIYDVISGRQPPMTTFYLRYYYGEVKCVKCGGEFSDLDHIIGIKEGAGGCWFSNYQFLCVECHATKTAEDNNWLKSKRLQND